MKKLVRISFDFRLVGNALKRVLTSMLKKLDYEHVHVYGTVVISSEYCNNCKQDAFVIGGKFTCCGRGRNHAEKQRITFEIDKVGVRRKEPSKKEKREMLEVQRNRCFYCRAKFGTIRVIKGKPKEVIVNWDHYVPFCYDGNNYRFVAACQECNMAKGAFIFDDINEARSFLRRKLHEKLQKKTGT